MTATQSRSGGSPAPVRRPSRRSDNPVVRFWRSAIGKKWVMAVTGIMLLGFVLAHMIGNLKMFLGPEEIDHYSEFLRELLVPLLPRGVALWLLRFVLIGALILHLHAAYTLTVMNRRARPVKYQSSRDYIAANPIRWALDPENP